MIDKTQPAFANWADFLVEHVAYPITRVPGFRSITQAWVIVLGYRPCIGIVLWPDDPFLTEIAPTILHWMD
jgi:hypothetical protein